MNYVDQYINDIEKLLLELKAARQKEWVVENKDKIIADNERAAAVMWQYYGPTHYESLDLTEGPGDKLVFTGSGGYKSELEYAMRVLKIGQHYTIADITIHNFHSTIELKEFPDTQFNSVMFGKST